MKRTAAVEVDQPFEYVCNVTKSYVAPDGRRIVRGVASGIAEDRSGERVSRNAISKMAAQTTASGAVKVTSSHDQDWLTEFGDVTKLEHDTEHDELLVECALPPEGEDPIADKAWRALTVEGQKLGFSIGGKLRKAFYELVPRGTGVMKRKVLDEIDLRHVALTKKPCLPGTFAEAVAKTFDGEIPDVDEFTLDTDDDDVAKATPEEDPEQGDPAAGDEAAPEGEPTAAAGDTADEPTDAEDTAQLPEAKRHLSCPNCGHEFAAPMPTDGNTDDPADDTNSTNPDEDDAETRKSQEDTTMDTITDTVAKLRTLAEGETAEVAKTDETAEVTAEAVDVDAVEKTDETEVSDVEKMLAASHRSNAEAIAELREQSNDALSAVAKTLSQINERLMDLPSGRKSLARVLPPHGEVTKSETETDDVAKRIEDADSPVEALKVLNEQTYGIK